ncbi:hypothetical protein [uncultured Photobacterium sp.]|uniref:hypothetical protein n=1 Tax=uncultured Photobacterium sp. TaxID=173973 RepID=UPI00260D015E|nr:hypothetical protein [uncultured Photobacterium sp.]
MKRSAYTFVLLGTSLMMIPGPSFARSWVEIGAEYEQYLDETDKGVTYNYERLNSETPYIRFSHSPSNNKWNIWGRAFTKIYPNEDLFTNNTTTSITERLELHYTKMIRRGSWRFRPGFGIRYNGYDIDRHETEYRFYPQVDYFLTQKNQLFFNGHWYIGDSRGKRMSDSAAQHYVDWGYEAEFGLQHRFNDGSAIRPHFYNEFDSFENNYDVKYWQFRLVYTKKYGRATINPFIRYGLGRIITDRSHHDPERWGLSRNNNYSRAGIYGNVGISGKWHITYETYYQVEHQHSPQGDELPDRDKSFFKLGIQRIF